MGLNKAVDPNTADCPQYSRIFVIFNKQDPLTESELTNLFSRFGNIEGIYIVNDKTTNLSKGFAYIKFSKMSEAMLAIEEMNKMEIESHEGTLYVRVAKNITDGKYAEEITPDQLRRLFVTIPKGIEEEEVRDVFSVFGEIIEFRMFKPKVETDERSNLIYITFKRVSSTAKALEDVNKQDGYKVRIATPQALRSKLSKSNEVAANFNSSLHVTCSSVLTIDLISRLFDIAPGFKSVELISIKGPLSQYIVSYETPFAAMYARNKYNCLEYPMGDYLIVNSCTNKNTARIVPPLIGKRDYSGDPVINESIPTKVPLIASVPIDTTPLVLTPICSVPLPPYRTKLPKSAYTETSGQRLFFTFHPGVPRMSAIDDAFCRFGNYCGAHIIPNKNFGYAYFACPHSADRALQKLNESYINMMKISVSIAKPKPVDNNK